MYTSRWISFTYFTRNKRNDIFVTTLNTLNLLHIRPAETIFYLPLPWNFEGDYFNYSGNYRSEYFFKIEVI